MQKKAIVLIIFSLLVILPMQFRTARASPGTIYVPDNYPTIQEAVYKAIPGDTIIVRAGTYYENVIVNQSSLVLIGENSATTIIDGRGLDNVVTLNNATISISGFTIRNGKSFSGIEAPTFGNHRIFNNRLTNNAFGINLLSSSGNTVIDNNLIDNSLVGIQAKGTSNNNITRNYVTQSTYGILLEASNNNFINSNTVPDTSYGIYLYSSNWNDVDKNSVSAGKVVGIYSIYSSNGDIRDNTVTECAYGIELYGGTANNVLRNTATNNAYGIYLVTANTGNVVDSNLVSNSDWGITFYDSDSNTVTFNTASYNSYGIYLTSSSTGNTIYKNNFLENVFQAFQHGNSPNTWYIKTAGKNYGNYWSDYLGEDTNGDGVGDYPPESLPHWGVDNYPLMNPTLTVHDVGIISVEASPTTVYVGETVTVTVIARNEGTANETFTVTAKYFSRIINTQTVANLVRYASTTLVFNWNTTGVPPGFNYEISAEASLVVGETDKLDNTFIDGTVTVFEVHDVAVKKVTPSRTVAYLGYANISIEVEVKNEGTASETFKVTAYYNSTAIGTLAVTLTPGETKILNFTWNTLGVSPSYYIISATAESVLYETDLADNSLSDGTVHVKIPGDINSDRNVDILDAAEVSAHWYPGPPVGPEGYNPNADINNDGNIDITDASIVSANWGRTE